MAVLQVLYFVDERLPEVVSKNFAFSEGRIKILNFDRFNQKRKYTAPQPFTDETSKNFMSIPGKRPSVVNSSFQGKGRKKRKINEIVF